MQITVIATLSYGEGDRIDSTYYKGDSLAQAMSAAAMVLAEAERSPDNLPSSLTKHVWDLHVQFTPVRAEETGGDVEGCDCGMADKGAPGHEHGLVGIIKAGGTVYADEFLVEDRRSVPGSEVSTEGGVIEVGGTPVIGVQNEHGLMLEPDPLPGSEVSTEGEGETWWDFEPDNSALTFEDCEFSGWGDEWCAGPRIAVERRVSPVSVTTGRVRCERHVNTPPK